jgi:hypothetical protein
MKHELVDLTMQIVRETDKAICVRDAEDRNPVWLPRSQIEVSTDGAPRGCVIVTMPEWLALDKGLI